MLKTKITVMLLSIIFIFNILLSLISIYNIKKFQTIITKDINSLTLKKIKYELKDYVSLLAQNLDNIQKIYPTDPYTITKGATDKLFLSYLIPLYEKYKNDKEIKKIIFEIIKTYKYEIPLTNLKKSFIIVNAKNNTILYHPKKELITKKLYIPKGPYQGFIQQKNKYLFFKLFKPFNWIIVCEISQKDVFSIEQKIYNIIKKIKWGEGHYFFGYKKTNNDFIFVFDPQLTGKLDVNKKDATGKLYRKELLKTALKGGGFVTYYYKNPTTNKIEKKITYATYYPPLKLIIATGTHIREIDNITQTINNEITANIIKNIIHTLLINVCVLIISFIIFYLLISKFLIRPLNSLNNAIHSLKEIQNSEKDIYSEFSEFVKDAENKLINVIKLLKGI